MRFTIERMRTLVLAAGVLLVVALAAFLTVGKWRQLLTGSELPTKLAKNVVQESKGVTYSEAHGGHMIFRIHAASAEQLKNQHALLHGVKIEFFSKDGRSVDSISGSDFEYDQKLGVGTAQGSVEITLTRPPTPAADGAKLPEVPAAAGTVNVETSGLSFNQNTGVLTTANKVKFSMAGGNGSAVGATYDSEKGFLVLDRSVELTSMRGGRKVIVRAQHAEFERDAQLCRLTDATTAYNGGQATAGQAKILFGKDGSAQRLDAADGFTLATTSGRRVTSPAGSLAFGPHNEPKSGEMHGGVTLESTSGGKHLQGSAPSAEMQFGRQGELQEVALIHGVEMHSETLRGAGTQVMRVSRTWRSPIARVNFRDLGNGRMEPAELHGSGGVVVTTQTQRGHAAPVPLRLAADEVTGEFGPGAELTLVTGIGHASMQQVLSNSARENASGDRIEVRFAPPGASAEKRSGERDASAEIQSAVLQGHVVLLRQPLEKPGSQPQAPLRALAGRAEYQDSGEQLHLTESPRVEQNGLQLTATMIDVSQRSGSASAHGDVKATWVRTATTSGRAKAAGEAGTPAFDGQAPAHVVADEAQFSQATGQAIFRGHARLWQESNSIAAPLVVLDRKNQTLVATSSTDGEPVEAVLLGTSDAAAAIAPRAAQPHQPGAQHGPSLIRVRGGKFTYSGADHRAVMTGAPLGTVVAYTGGATCTAQEVVLLLRQRGADTATAEVERVTASGHVVVSSQGRKGAGAKLVYSSLTGEYALTGTPAEPPRLTDPARGTVTGAALIFNSRNDSVSIEGRGQETRMETTAPR
jgi:lipopolysaccharide export system protein LptA